MTHHHHEDTGAGVFAGMSAMMFMLIALVLVVLLLAAVFWRPWAGDGTTDNDVAPGGGLEDTLPGSQPGGGTDGGGGTGGGGTGGGGTAPGSYRFGAEGMPSVIAAAEALTGIEGWSPLAA